MSNILVVEDNPVNMELVRDLLEINGHDVFEASNGQAAIEIASRVKPDLILMDIQLPGIDGLEAARIISGNNDLSHIPIVALTAFAMKADENKAKASGCVGFITKPIDTREFPKLIKGYVSDGDRS